MELRLPLFKKNETTNIDVFIEYWKKFYEPDKYNDENYVKNLKPINELTGDNIEELFKWKNGMPLSSKKLLSVNKIKEKLAEIREKFESNGSSINELKKIYDASFEFFDGYVWNLFLLHILRYKNCPIADKYVYRAFNYICNGDNELPVRNWDTYVKYMEFFNEIAVKTTRHTRKEIDEAFWGFGKFLSSNYIAMITE